MGTYLPAAAEPCKAEEPSSRLVSHEVPCVGWCAVAILTRFTVPAVMQLSVGDTVEVSLEAQTGAGYLWTVSPDFGGHVEVAHSYVHGSGIGSPSEQLVRLTARAEGADRLRFDYRRPWEAPHVDDHFVIDIQVAS